MFMLISFDNLVTHYFLHGFINVCFLIVVVFHITYIHLFVVVGGRLPGDAWCGMQLSTSQYGRFCTSRG